MNVCPKKFPRLMLHTGQKQHGDVCRKSKNKNYSCPKGCFKTPNGKRPFCQMDKSNDSPCRLECEDGFPRLQTFADTPQGPQHGNVCRKANNNNFSCPRGCKKTKGGKAPFCSESKNPFKPCRKP